MPDELGIMTKTDFEAGMAQVKVEIRKIMDKALPKMPEHERKNAEESFKRKDNFLQRYLLTYIDGREQVRLSTLTEAYTWGFWHVFDFWPKTHEGVREGKYPAVDSVFTEKEIALLRQMVIYEGMHSREVTEYAAPGYEHGCCCLIEDYGEGKLGNLDTKLLAELVNRAFWEIAYEQFSAGIFPEPYPHKMNAFGYVMYDFAKHLDLTRTREFYKMPLTGGYAYVTEGYKQAFLRAEKSGANRFNEYVGRMVAPIIHSIFEDALSWENTPDDPEAALAKGLKGWERFLYRSEVQVMLAELMGDLLDLEYNDDPDFSVWKAEVIARFVKGKSIQRDDTRAELISENVKINAKHIEKLITGGIPITLFNYRKREEIADAVTAHFHNLAKACRSFSGQNIRGSLAYKIECDINGGTHTAIEFVNKAMEAGYIGAEDGTHLVEEELRWFLSLEKKPDEIRPRDSAYARALAKTFENRGMPERLVAAVVKKMKGFNVKKEDMTFPIKYGDYNISEAAKSRPPAKSKNATA